MKLNGSRLSSSELVEQGVLLEALADSAGRELSPFDLICHVAFDQPPLTRQERANNVKKRDVFTQLRQSGARRSRGIARQIR